MSKTNNDVLLSKAQYYVDELDSPTKAKINNFLGIWFVVWLLITLIIGISVVYTRLAAEQYNYIAGKIWIIWLFIGVFTLIVPIVLLEDSEDYQPIKHDKEIQKKIKANQFLATLSAYDRLNIYNLVRIAKVNNQESQALKIMQDSQDYNRIINNLLDLTRDYIEKAQN